MTLDKVLDYSRSQDVTLTKVHSLQVWVCQIAGRKQAVQYKTENIG